MNVPLVRFETLRTIARGATTVSDLSDKTGVPTTTVYDRVFALRKDGLVRFVKQPRTAQRRVEVTDRGLLVLSVWKKALQDIT